MHRNETPLLVIRICIMSRIELMEHGYTVCESSKYKNTSRHVSYNCIKDRLCTVILTLLMYPLFE